MPVDGQWMTSRALANLVQQEKISADSWRRDENEDGSEGLESESLVSLWRHDEDGGGLEVLDLATLAGSSKSRRLRSDAVGTCL